MRTRTARLERISCPDSAAAFGVIGARSIRMIMLKRWLSCSAVTVLAAGCLFAQTPARVQSFPLRDATGLIAPKVKAEAVKYLGRESVRITIDGEDHEGLVLLPETDFQDGTIEADIALKRSEERRVGKEGRSRWSPDH